MRNELNNQSINESQEMKLKSAACQILTDDFVQILTNSISYTAAWSQTQWNTALLIELNGQCSRQFRIVCLRDGSARSQITSKGSRHSGTSTNISYRWIDISGKVPTEVRRPWDGDLKICRRESIFAQPSVIPSEFVGTLTLQEV